MSITEKLHLMEEMEVRNYSRLRVAGLVHRAGKTVRRIFRAAAEDKTAYLINIACAAGMDAMAAALEMEGKKVTA